jgi:hypothetical protein
MKAKALQELRRIVELDGLNRKDGRSARIEALDGWIDTWVGEISVSQSIIKKSLTNEDRDVILQYIVEEVAQQLMDDYAKVEITPSKVEVKTMVFKR